MNDPSAPLERQVIMKEGPDTGVSLQGGVGVPALLISDPGLQFGSLQTVFDGQRTVLIATSTGVPAQDEASAGNEYNWAWWVAGGVVAAAAIGAMVILFASRRT